MIWVLINWDNIFGWTIPFNFHCLNKQLTGLCTIQKWIEYELRKQKELQVEFKCREDLIFYLFIYFKLFEIVFKSYEKCFFCFF